MEMFVEFFSINHQNFISIYDHYAQYIHANKIIIYQFK